MDEEVATVDASAIREQVMKIRHAQERITTRVEEVLTDLIDARLDDHESRGVALIDLEDVRIELENLIFRLCL